MGVSLGMPSCSVYPQNTSSPNPNPAKFKILKVWKYNFCYLIYANYPDCTTFEGNKLMLYKGKYEYKNTLDPHFDKTDESPIARFKPTQEGFDLAFNMIMSIECSYIKQGFDNENVRIIK